MKPSMFDLTGQVTVISGGGTGIGKAIALGMAEAGSEVVLCSRRVEICQKAADEIAAQTGVRTRAFPCDTSSKSDIDALVKNVIDEFGCIDILVNNAAATNNIPFFEITEEEWDRVIDTNLKGCFLFSQTVARGMARSGGGAIINIGSQLGSVARPNKAHYITSKGGIAMLTRALAADLAPYGIRVNTVAPGPVETDLSSAMFSDPVVCKQVLERLLIKRMGQPEDIAGAVVFLAGKASSFITGATVYVDGGYTAT